MAATTAIVTPPPPINAPKANAEPRCATGWRFTDMRKKRARLKVSERRRIENPTNQTASVTFSSKKSKTVKMSTSVRIKASYNAIFASVEAEVDAGVEKSYTNEIGEAVTYKVPSSRAALGSYGVFIRPVTGRLKKGDGANNCVYDRRITAYLPKSSGWRIGLEKLGRD